MSGDSAIADLVKDYPLFVKVACQFVGKEYAPDLVQACFVKALLKKDRILENGNPKQWMAMIVRNESINQYRIRLRRERREAEHMPYESSASTSEELSDRMADALDQLPEESKKMLLEYAVEGKSARHLAFKYQMPKSAIRTQLYKACLEMRRLISRAYQDGMFDF